jgi:hypothetical protein
MPSLKMSRRYSCSSLAGLYDAPLKNSNSFAFILLIIRSCNSKTSGLEHVASELSMEFRFKNTNVTFLLPPP